MHALAALLQAGDPVPAGRVARSAAGAAGPRAPVLDPRRRPVRHHPDPGHPPLSGRRRHPVGRHHTRRRTPRTRRQPARADPDTTGNVADWLATLYQDRKRFWSGLQPDPLAEYFIGTVLGPGGGCPSLVADTLNRVSAGQLEHGLTLLGRAHPHHPHLTHAITDIVLTAGRPGRSRRSRSPPASTSPNPCSPRWTSWSTPPTWPPWHALDGALPRFSLLLGPTSVNAALRLVELRRDAAAVDRDAYLPDLAASVNNLAVRLAEAGRRAEGLAAAQEAVDLLPGAGRGQPRRLPARPGHVGEQPRHRLAEAGRRAEAPGRRARRPSTCAGSWPRLNRDAYLPDLPRR